MQRSTRESGAISPDDSTQVSAVVDDSLPPRELWPEYVYTLPELQYPDALNAADVLLRSASTSPNRAAIRWRGQALTYAGLRARTLALARGLANRGVKLCDRVCLRLPNSPDFVAAWLAIQWLGAIGVPIATAYRRREVVHILSHSDAAFVVCDESFSSEFDRTRQDARSGAVAAFIETLGDEPLSSPACPTGRDQPALLTYITGADGILKGVVHSPAELLASADTYARDVLQITSADICVGTPSLAWAFGLGALLTFPLRAGATIVLLDGPMALLQTIADERATVLFATPTMYRMLLAHPDLERSDLRSLRCCVSAAEPLPADVVEAWRVRTGLEILDGFGTTELTHIVISARPGSVRPGYLGTVVAGYEARIVDEDLRDMPDGTAGQLAVRGPTGARYWRDIDAQRRAVRRGWTLTGDVCVREADGWFRHVSRSDSLVVSAGYKIAPIEVERALEAHPAVASARVVAVPDPVRGAVTHAVVAPKLGVDATGLGERLQQYLKTELAPFKCPREIRIE